MFNPDKISREREQAKGVTEEGEFEIKNKQEIPSENKKLEEFQNEIIKIPEGLSLSSQDRMNLVLTHSGEKPCSAIEIDYFGKNPLDDIKKTEEEVDRLREVLESNGLEFSILESEEEEDGFDQKEFKFLISKDREKLDELQKALEEEDEEIIGKLYGFPDSAVEAFVQGWEEGKTGETMLDEKEWWRNLSIEDQEKLTEEGTLNFRNFKFSKEHWEEELRELKRWQDIIKDKAPDLCQEIEEKKPEMIMSSEELKEHEAEEAEKELVIIREKLDKVTDKLGYPIEDGIKETVVLFNAFNIRTNQSCEGHWEEDKETVPWVMVYPRVPEDEEWYEDESAREKAIDQSEAMKSQLIELLDIFYKDRDTNPDDMLGFKGVAYGFKLQSNEAESFKDLDSEQGQKKILIHRKEMQDFTDFLKEVYPRQLFKRPLINKTEETESVTVSDKTREQLSQKR